MNRRFARFLAVLGAAVLALGLTACGDDDTASAPTAEGAWARASAMMQDAGAIYLDLTGGDTDDTLVAATVPAEVAATVELHETIAMEEGDGDMTDGDHDHGDMAEGDHDHGDMEGMGMMTMREVAGGIPVPADETVVLEPGGLHIMLLDLAGPLEPGDSFDAVLSFDSGAELTVPVEIREG